MDMGRSIPPKKHHQRDTNFLDQDSYKQVGETTMSDFRYLYKADFKVVYTDENDNGFYFVLQKH